MQFLIAPDSYKECLSAREVAATVAAAVREGLPGCRTVEMPLADGGEGTLDVLAPVLGADIRTARVPDPLGRTVEARFALAGETAVIEIAEACGLPLLRPSERDPLVASTAGLGELLLAAGRSGARHFLVGLGGSATCDGGAGMLSVPGVKALLRRSSVDILSDVQIPLTGPDGAVQRYAPQKGARPGDLPVLEERLLFLAAAWKAETGRDVAAVPGAGAAGGLGGAFLAFAGSARMSSGVDRILELTGFDKALEETDLVITGEGCSDAQTLQGKLPSGVLRHAGSVPVALVSGSIEGLRPGGFAYRCPVTPPGVPLRQALDPGRARAFLRDAVLRLCHDFALDRILAARDARALRQRELLAAWPEAALLCLTVVFPGPVKRDERSVRVGEAGVAAIRASFATAVLYEEIRDLETGYEAFFVVDTGPQEAKLRTCAIEDTHPWGRLMDIDVVVDGPGSSVLPGADRVSVAPVSRSSLGLPERRCLLCDRPARECMRAHTHTLEQLLSRIDALLSR